MEEIIESLRPISRCLDKIQSILALDFLNDYLVDEDGPFKSIGRVGFLGCFLGIQWGIHFSCGCFLLWVSLWQQHDYNYDYNYDYDSSSSSFFFQFFDARRLAMAWTWCFYITAMCTFHLLEFFVTAFFNPTVVSSDSFLVNHSKAYTVAAIIASTEFWLRFWLGGTSTGTAATATNTNTNTNTNNWWWTTITILGIVMVIASQFIRSWAMMKCGESFNHYIQTSRKQNHVLVTNGIYTWLRHPSYTGFYYWSIGTQLVLHNPASALLFAVAGWKFFSQRIPYEERSLVRLFGDQYYDYAMRTYVGIPFIPSIPKDGEDQNKDHQQQQQGIEVEIEDKNKMAKKTK